ncbi:MAG: acyl transferase [Flavobacteriales bacterium CG_4_9_14_3_um_filter_40_17]|nr:MAG: acyl transferase [Flavobacteriales bacterium CG_4_9_14_3_um_filter_40_17]
MIDSTSIFGITAAGMFAENALDIFNFQFKTVQVYHDFCKGLSINPKEVDAIEKIPFLPISFFKSHKVFSKGKNAQLIFESSGTTGKLTSKHPVADESIYKNSFRRGFERVYGNISDFVVLALLPSYLERNNSSLVYMVADWISESHHPDSGFYLNEMEKLRDKLIALDAAGQRVILIGVSFALLDLAERYPMQLRNTLVMETGGMKGRRKELIRSELHQILKTGLGVPVIHSEYGMTELFSQAYSKGDGLFECPPWMKILICDPEDPLTLMGHQKNGGINVIDLANIYSCSFIATQDLGKTYADGCFEVLGRFDHADIRGCNLLVQ